MGILAENLVWMREGIANYGNKGTRMLELGNQFLYISGPPFLGYPEKLLQRSGEPFPVAKKYFESIGFDHTSIDINGQDGALPIDLCQPFDLGQFDVITDFGTSEHVVDLRACLLNLHHAGKVGTLYFHVNPMAGNWPGHGVSYRQKDFYRRFVEGAGYELLDTRVAASCGNITDGWTVWGMLRKTGEAFPEALREISDR